jgi:hypothetical protein
MFGVPDGVSPQAGFFESHRAADKPDTAPTSCFTKPLQRRNAKQRACSLQAVLCYVRGVSFGVNPERRCRWPLLGKLCPACS